jgi:hypothetical protein
LILNQRLADEDDMTEDMMVNRIICTVLLIALIIGVRWRKRSESQAAEVFRRQEEGQKILRDIAGKQTETNRLLREWIEDNRKK